MKIHSQPTDLSPIPGIAEESKTTSRVARRAQARFDRAAKRFRRTDLDVGHAVAKVRQIEDALDYLCDNSEADEVVVGDFIVPRTLVSDLLAMAERDLNVAVRRRRDAASRFNRCRLVAAAAIGHSTR